MALPVSALQNRSLRANNSVELPEDLSAIVHGSLNYQRNKMFLPEYRNAKVFSIDAVNHDTLNRSDVPDHCFGRGGKELHLDGDRIPEPFREFTDAAQREDSSLVDHRDAGAEVLGFGKVMRAQKNRLSLIGRKLLYDPVHLP